jgi:hypothetical protein
MHYEVIEREVHIRYFASQQLYIYYRMIAVLRNSVVVYKNRSSAGPPPAAGNTACHEGLFAIPSTVVIPLAHRQIAKAFPLHPRAKAELRLKREKAEFFPEARACV